MIKLAFTGHIDELVAAIIALTGVALQQIRVVRRAFSRINSTVIDIEDDNWDTSQVMPTQEICFWYKR